MLGFEKVHLSQKMALWEEEMQPHISDQMIKSLSTIFLNLHICRMAVFSPEKLLFQIIDKN